MPQHVNTFVLGIVKSPEILRNIKTEIRMSKFIRSQIGPKVFPRLPWQLSSATLLNHMASEKKRDETEEQITQ